MRYNDRSKILLFVLLCCLSIPQAAYSVEVAPRISDREIIESLAEIKQGQKDLNKRIDDLNQRFNDLNQRFNEMNNEINQRFESMQNLILTLFSSVMALIIGMIGYMIWDRKTAQQPLKARLYELEFEFENHLETKHPSGSKITRVITSLRKLAETDEKVAEILRMHSLL